MAYDSSDSLNALSYGIGGLASLGSAYAQSEALKSQGEFQLAMAKINKQFADLQASQVIDQGNEQAHAIRRKGEQVAGSQRAAAAAQGIDVNDSQGSAGEMIDDTKLSAAQDMATTKNNAWMTAWGIKTQAVLNINDAQGKKSAADFAANQTLLTGGLNALSAATKVGSIYAKGTVKTKTETPSSARSAAPRTESSGWFPDRPASNNADPGVYVKDRSLNWWEKPSTDEVA